MSEPGNFRDKINTAKMRGAPLIYDKPIDYLFEPGNFLNEAQMGTAGDYSWNPYAYERDLYDVPLTKEGKQWSNYVKSRNQTSSGGLGALVGIIASVMGLGPLGMALAGGIGSAIDGGNPLLGAVTGGLGGLAGGAGSWISGVSNGAISPAIGSALYSGGLGALSSGLQGGNPLTGALAGGLGSYAGNYVGGTDWAKANPIVGGAASGALSNAVKQMITSGQIDPKSLVSSGMLGGAYGGAKSGQLPDWSPQALQAVKAFLAYNANK
jgi:hypothetical protein